ncbi:MAG: aspartate-semialdehyde dehydrogenase [Alphaproteobacteria bacterium 32-64-14]|nr:MAG: aspartate-semialdehyde dehydrogenase [Alphaproteobacteria bacterium 32-64-14]
MTHSSQALASQTAELSSRAGVGTKTVAVVGATGAVGAEMLRCLEESSYPTETLKAFASERSAGKRFKFRGKDVEMQVLTDDAFEGCDAVLFASETDISKKYVPLAVKAGAYAIDNSSAFRMDASVPLVVPEVNGALITPAQKIYANPNCVAAIMVMALWPLHQAGKLKRVIASTYQSASGAGRPAMDELEEATRAYLKGEHYEPRVLPHPYAFNLFSHNTSIGADGYNGEETKVVAELRKIMGLPDLRVGVTCVRVPVLRAHSMAITAEFDSKVSVDAARALLSKAPGVKIVDNRETNHFPMPVESGGQNDVLVGRIREDISDPTGHSLALFISGDQLLKGAALNAVQIAERLI